MKETEDDEDQVFRLTGGDGFTSPNANRKVVSKNKQSGQADVTNETSASKSGGGG